MLDESERDDIEDDVCVPRRHPQLLQLPLQSGFFPWRPLKERVTRTRTAIKQSGLPRGVKNLLLAVFETGEVRNEISVSELCALGSISKRTFHRHEGTLKQHDIYLQRYVPVHGKHVAISRGPSRELYYALLLLNDDAHHCKYCQLVASPSGCGEIHALLNALTAITGDFPSLRDDPSSKDDDAKPCRILLKLFTLEVIVHAIQRLWRSWKHFDGALPLTARRLCFHMLAHLDVYETRDDADTESVLETTRMTEERLRVLVQTNEFMRSIGWQSPEKVPNCHNERNEIPCLNGTKFRYQQNEIPSGNTYS